MRRRSKPMPAYKARNLRRQARLRVRAAGRAYAERCKAVLASVSGTIGIPSQVLASRRPLDWLGPQLAELDEAFTAELLVEVRCAAGG